MVVSKKLTVTIVTAVLALVLKGQNVDDTTITQIVAIGIGYVGGQGLADFGKERKNVQDNDASTDPAASDGQLSNSST